MASEKIKGVVKWFDTKKGYGFLRRLDGGQDVFVHFQDIVGTGYKNLEEDQKVEFDITDCPKGKKAANVTVIA